jgi:hypothetical protein
MARIVWRVAPVIVACAMVLALAGLTASPSSGSTASERKVERRLVGGWRLVSGVFQDADGKTTGYVYGPHPVGKLTYTRDVDVWVLTASPDLSTNPIPPSWLAGQFHVDLSRHCVVHHVQYASFASYKGTDQLRYYTLRGRKLTLASAPPGEARYVFQWRKVS